MVWIEGGNIHRIGLTRTGSISARESKGIDNNNTNHKPPIALIVDFMKSFVKKLPTQIPRLANKR
ncbi:hypothetical protein J43TS3_32600 [Ornithinibacillus bavariensis]|uniref:Uncharacterized protein n=1 Tax=Ornithinibacillus bavariensis TaxID=545502 RepID=A0A919XBL0_9BACI|nr:hypothetical protein J43TS3_32600 [Ornithinibacillus bavariensis]